MIAHLAVSTHASCVAYATSISDSQTQWARVRIYLLTSPLSPLSKKSREGLNTDSYSYAFPTLPECACPRISTIKSHNNHLTNILISEFLLQELKDDVPGFSLSYRRPQKGGGGGRIGGHQGRLTIPSQNLTLTKNCSPLIDQLLVSLARAIGVPVRKKVIIWVVEVE